MINSYLLYYANSSFGDYILNFVKISTENANLINSQKNKNILLLYITINYILPLVNDIFAYLMNSKLIKISKKIENLFKNLNFYFKSIKIILDLGYKLAYLFKKKFLYTDIVEHLLKLMTVNQGSKEVFSDKFLNVGKQLNLFFLYMFIRIGEWYYQKENKIDKVADIKPPIKEEYKECPLCKIDTSQIQSPIALRCCGYVYCENCINNYMKHHTKCRNCNISISNVFLIKIYHN